MPPPVTAERIQIAKDFGLANVDTAATACREVGLPFWAACTLLDKESNGENIYGHDQGGIHSLPGGQNMEVTAENFVELLVKVMNGATSNGVGPCQITFAGSLKNGHRDGGYFRLMSERRLLPWVVHDNMVFGFAILGEHYGRNGSWFAAAKSYNGKESYGHDFVKVANEWRERLAIKGGPIT